MNYELAKKLKDLGFPQPEDPDTGHYSSWTIKEKYGFYYTEDGKYKNNIFPGLCYYREHVYIPTLKELINELYKLGRGRLKIFVASNFKLEEDAGLWMAEIICDGKKYKVGEIFKKRKENILLPEIAVAKLYIKLKENK